MSNSTSKDYYAVLGVNVRASGDEIKKRYRELARRYHPDVNPHPDAAQKIKAINEAYAVLGDAERRATFDAGQEFQAQTVRSASRPTTPSQPPRPDMGAGRGAQGGRTLHETPRASASAAKGGSQVDFDGFGRVVSEAAWRAQAAGAASRPSGAQHAPPDISDRFHGKVNAGSTAQTSSPAPRARTAAQRSAAEAAEQVSQLVSEARLAFINRQYAHAEKLCRQIIRLDGRNAGAYELLGDSARKQGDTDAAIQAYSFAIQLNPRNYSVQANLDRLMGGSGKGGHSGPTLSRSAPTSLTERIGHEGLVSGLGVLALLGVSACLGFVYRLPGNGVLGGLSLNLLLSLPVCGLLSGFLLALYGGMRPQSQELAARGAGAAAVPLRGVLTLFALLWFVASALVYVVVAVTQNRVSASVLRAYALALFLNVVFVLLYHPLDGARGAFSVPTAAFAGNLLFPTILMGWKWGDALRLGRYGGS